jgi:hypothetical protein
MILSETGILNFPRSSKVLLLSRFLLRLAVSLRRSAATPAHQFTRLEALRVVFLKWGVDRFKRVSGAAFHMSLQQLLVLQGSVPCVTVQASWLSAICCFGTIRNSAKNTWLLPAASLGGSAAMYRLCLAPQTKSRWQHAGKFWQVSGVAVASKLGMFSTARTACSPHRI